MDQGEALSWPLVTNERTKRHFTRSELTQTLVSNIDKSVCPTPRSSLKLILISTCYIQRISNINNSFHQNRKLYLKSTVWMSTGPWSVVSSLEFTLESITSSARIFVLLRAVICSLSFASGKYDSFCFYVKSLRAIIFSIGFASRKHEFYLGHYS